MFIKIIELFSVKSEDAERIVLRHHRERDARSITLLYRLGAPGPDMRVNFDVVGPERLAGPDCNTNRTLTSFGVRPSRFDAFHVSLFISRLRDRTNRLLCVELTVTDPCHTKSADLYENAADGLQKFGLIGGMDESLVALVKRPQGPV